MKRSSRAYQQFLNKAAVLVALSQFALCVPVARSVQNLSLLSQYSSQNYNQNSRYDSTNSRMSTMSFGAYSESFTSPSLAPSMHYDYSSPSMTNDTDSTTRSATTENRQWEQESTHEEVGPSQSVQNASEGNMEHQQRETEEHNLRDSVQTEQVLQHQAPQEVPMEQRLNPFETIEGTPARTLARFRDVDAAHPYRNEIEAAVDLGFFAGNPDGTFNPTGFINRAEFAAVMTRNATDDQRMRCRTLPPFYTDVPANAWFRESTCLARIMGLMQGQGNGTMFGPAEHLNLAQAAKIVAVKFDLPVEHDANAEWYTGYMDTIEASSALPPTINVAAKMIRRDESTYLIVRVVQGLAKVGEYEPPSSPASHPAPPASRASSSRSLTILWSSDILGGGVSREGSCADARKDALRDALGSGKAASDWGSDVPSLVKACLQGGQYKEKGKSWGLNPYPTVENGSFSWSTDLCAKDKGIMVEPNCCQIPSNVDGKPLYATVGRWKMTFHCFADLGGYQ